MASGKGLDLLEERIGAQKAKKGMKLDPVTIAMLIAAIYPVIKNCLNPTPETLRRKLFNRAPLALSIRKENPSMRFVAAFQEADDLMDLAKEAKDEELQLVIDDCR